MQDGARKSRILRAVLLVAKAFLITGCIIPFNGPGDIKRDVQHATGNDLDMDFGVTVGRSGMAFARWIAGKSDEQIPLEGIKKVEVGVYEVIDPTPGERRAINSLQWPGWIPVVEIYGEENGLDAAASDDGESDDGSADVLILFQYDEDQLERMLMLIEEKDDRLVIVRISGKLNQLIEQVIAYGLEESDHPELIDPAIDSWRNRETPSPDGHASQRTAR
jgi:hypothetical protein